MLKPRALFRHFRISFFKPDTHYDILGVGKTSSEAQIRKAYLKKAKQYHPDRNQSPEAVQIFKQLGQAYKTLSDPYMRKAYDMGVTNPSMSNPDMESTIKPNVSANQQYYNNKWYGYRKPSQQTLRDEYTSIYWQAQEMQKENIKKFMRGVFRYGLIFIFAASLVTGYFQSKRLRRKRAMQNEIIKGQNTPSTRTIGSIPVREYIEMRYKENMAD